MLVLVPVHKHESADQAVQCWTIIAQTAAEKRLLCCKHEMYSPRHSGECLLYESQVQCKKLCLVCMCRGMGAQTGLCEGYLHLGVIALPKHMVSSDKKSEIKPKGGFPLAGDNQARVVGAAHQRFPGAGHMRSPLLPSRARRAELCPARLRLEINLILDSSPR